MATQAAKTKTSGSSGLNRHKRFQAAGLDVSEKRVEAIALNLIVFPKGHLAHLRENDPLNEEMVEDIREKGVHTSLLVWERVGKDGKIEFWLCDGAQRLNHAYAAEKRKHKDGSLKKDERLKVPCRFFEGDEAAFLRARQLADSDHLKRPHVASVIAWTLIQLSHFNDTIENMIGVLPRNYVEGGNGRAIVESMLRWKSMEKRVADAFDNGIEIEVDGETQTRLVPIGLLPSIMKIDRSTMFDMLKKLVTNGFTHQRGASRFIGAEMQRMAAGVPSSPGSGSSPSEPTNGASTGSEPASDAESARGSEASGGASAGGSSNSGAGNARPVLVEAKRPGFVRRCVALASEREVQSPEEKWFWTGATAALFDDADLEVLVAALANGPKLAKHVLAGVLFRAGKFPAAVQTLVHDDVIETWAKAQLPKAKPAKDPAAPKATRKSATPRNVV